MTLSAQLAAAPAWLLQQVTVSDTVITRIVSEDPSIFDKVTSIAGGLTSLVLLVLTAALVPAAWNVRKTQARLNKLIERVQDEIVPIVKHAGAVADDVHYLTTSLRADMQQVSQTVAGANERVQAAILTTERRLRDFSALVDVAQGEAEDLLVRSASTMRGVRAGVDTLRVTPEPLIRPRGKTHPAPEPTLDRPIEPMTGDDDGDLFERLDDHGSAERPRTRTRRDF